ncbi:MAG: bifunctional diguanylate cyclase/phosphodiesterase [Peptostreptococcaceae bacterium]
METGKNEMDIYASVFSKVYDMVAVIDMNENVYKIIHSKNNVFTKAQESLELLYETFSTFIYREDRSKFRKYSNLDFIKKYFSENYSQEINFDIRIFETNNGIKLNSMHKKCNVSILPIDNRTDQYLCLIKKVNEDNIDDILNSIDNDYDALTGVYRKEVFFKKIESLLQENVDEKFAVIRFDIDKFKMINDAYSEEFGDITLKYLGKNLRLALENRDKYIVGRIGGDVFAVVYPYSQENTHNLVDEIEKVVNNYEMSLLVCYGIYVIEDNYMVPSLICDRAHLAQKEIKGNSINRVSYYDELIREKYVDEAQITSCMHQALKDGAFQVYLQPKCSLDNNSPIGAEALVRWINPTEGLIAPYRFIPIFEKNNFIIKLDEYIWDKSCEVIKRIEQELGIKIPVSVNVSRNHINNPDFVKGLVEIVERHDIDKHMLHIEITESAFTENHKRLSEAITTLRELGFYVEIDDFGSGYSSLNVLKDIDVDAIKLDMCFLRGEYLTERAQKILFAVIEMANSLELDIIPEGIETQEHVEFLKEAGCIIGQGYYFEKPIPVDDFINYLRDNYTEEV